MKKLTLSVAIAAILALPLSSLAGTGHTADTDHSHHHDAHGSMELNDGEKWETDAALRQGMSELHQVVSAGLERAHADALTSEDYNKIAADIMVQFNYIVENCALEPKPDAQLHILLADIMQGVQIIEGKVSVEQPENGLIKMAEALNNYGVHFDHPQWKNLDVSH